MSARILLTSSPAPFRSPNSESAVMLLAVICALFCFLALVLLRCCSWRTSSPSTGKKCIKKADLDSLPKFTLNGENLRSANLSGECAICLAGFKDGEEVRVLPQCGHGFHAGCVDMWLGSNSSCPTCRQDLVVIGCDGGTIRPEPRESHVTTSLPSDFKV